MMSSSDPIIILDSDSEDEKPTVKEEDIEDEYCTGMCVKLEEELKRENSDDGQEDTKVETDNVDKDDPLRSSSSELAKEVGSSSVIVGNVKRAKSKHGPNTSQKKKEAMDIYVKIEDVDDTFSPGRDFMDEMEIEVKSEDDEIEKEFGVTVNIDGEIDPLTLPVQLYSEIAATTREVQTNENPDMECSLVTEDTPVIMLEDLPGRQSMVTTLESQMKPKSKKAEQHREMCCLVDKLSKLRFLTDPSWTSEEKARIVRKGRPLIGLKKLAVTPKVFERFDWITGCVERTKLFCWECLLFDDSGGVWSRGVVPDINVKHVMLISQKHEATEEHSKANKKMRGFMRNDLKRKTSDETQKPSGRQMQMSKKLQRIQSDPMPSTSTVEQQPLAETFDLLQTILQSSQLQQPVDGPSLSRGRSPLSIIDDDSTSISHQRGSSSATRRTLQTFAKIDGEKDIVKLLVQVNFVRGHWAKGDQELIVARGRQCPNMRTVLGHIMGDSENLFDDKLYEQYQWLTGSADLENLFCWPCLLYSTDESIINVSVNSGNRNLVFDNHELSSGHLEACLCLKLIEYNIATQNKKKEKDEIAFALAKDREFLNHMIDVICTMKTQINNADPLHNDYVDLLKLISCYNVNLERFLLERSQETGNEAAQVHVEKYAEITRDSIKEYMIGRIKKELQETPFVSILLDDVKVLLNKSCISITLRYADGDGTVRQRFVKFIEVGFDRQCNTILPRLTATIDELDCKTKIIGFTYDGATIKTSEIAKFNHEMQKQYPTAMFFHNPHHNLKTLVQQALSHLKICRNFFRHFEHLRNFFNNTPKAITALVKLQRSLHDAPGSEPEPCNFTDDFITTTKKYYRTIVQLFESIEATPNDWDIGTVVQAPYHLNFLRNIENKFLIVSLNRVFAGIEPFTKVLQGDFDLAVWKNRVHMALIKLVQLKNTGLDSICANASNEGLEDEEKTAITQDARNLKSEKTDMFNFMIDTITKFIATRAQTIDALQFVDCGLVSSLINKEQNRTVDIELCLKIAFNHEPLNQMFNITKLKAQLDFHFTNQVFKRVTTINGLVNAIHVYGMASSLPELHRFLRLLLTVPVSSPVILKTDISEKLALYVKQHNKTILNSTNALMWLEKELLTTLQKEEDFNDSIINLLSYKLKNLETHVHEIGTNEEQ